MAKTMLTLNLELKAGPPRRETIYEGYLDFELEEMEGTMERFKAKLKQFVDEETSRIKEAKAAQEIARRIK
jgi:hypothetical protein